MYSTYFYTITSLNKDDFIDSFLLLLKQMYTTEKQQINYCMSKENIILLDRVEHLFNGERIRQIIKILDQIMTRFWF